MPLESATYIQDLVASNPVGATDPKSDGDNHLRLIKQVLKNTFPTATGAISISTFIKTLLDDVDAATARATIGAGVSSYADPLTTRGDVLFRNAANATARLPVGAANRLLRSNGTDPSWAQVALATDVTGLLPLASLPDFDTLTLTDNPASLAYVVGTTGAGVNRKFRTGEVGGWVPLELKNAAASASLDFVLTPYLTDFEDFEFILNHISPSVDGSDLWLRTSTDGGVSYDAGAGAYAWQATNALVGAITGTGSASDTQMQLNSINTIGNAANEFVSGRVLVINPSPVVARMTAIWHLQGWTTATAIITVQGSGARLGAQDNDAIRFMFSSGTITVGAITMMGRRKVTL